MVEDLHWIDASTLEFLGHFVGEGPHDRILTVLTFRPEFKTPWPAPAHQTTLALNPLTRRQMAEWMRRDAGGTLPDSLVAQIYHRTSGVPLLVEEFTRMARESAVFESAVVASPGVSAGEHERTAPDAAGACDGPARSYVDAIARWPNSQPRWGGSLTTSCSLPS